MSQSDKIKYATMRKKTVTKWQNYTCYTVANNRHNWQSEFTVRDIYDKNVAIFCKNLISIFAVQASVYLEFYTVYLAV